MSLPGPAPADDCLPAGAPLRVAVIGVGSMGRHHVRVLSSLQGVDVVAVADVDAERAAAVAAGAGAGAAAYGDHHRLLAAERLDAVCVAVTTDEHYRVGLDCLAAGLHVLMEKPLAASLEEGEALAAAAAAAGVRLVVGHVERFNPALRKLRRLLDRGELGRVTSIVARRVGGCPPRLQDVNIVVDLAIHDLDICRLLLGREPTHVSGTVGQVHLADRFDHAEIFLDFDGVGCFVQANWITPVSIRTLAVTGERGYVELDYVTQRLSLYRVRRRAPHDSFADLVSGLDAQLAEPVAVARQEPLRLELAAFVRDVVTGSATSVPVAEGLSALAIAERVVDGLRVDRRRPRLQATGGGS